MEGRWSDESRHNCRKSISKQKCGFEKSWCHIKDIIDIKKDIISIIIIDIPLKNIPLHKYVIICIEIFLQAIFFFFNKRYSRYWNNMKLFILFYIYNNEIRCDMWQLICYLCINIHLTNLHLKISQSQLINLNLYWYRSM